MKVLIVGLILLLAGIQVRLWSGPGSIAEIQRLESKLQSQSDENEGLLMRNDTILWNVNELKSGMDAIEEIARNDLGLIRQGETFYLFLD